MTSYLWPPPAPAALTVRGSDVRLPVHRLFFVGRNYHAHAREMGVVIDKASACPFDFTKSPVHLLPSGATLPYPPGTADFHHEVELVVVLGRGAITLEVNGALRQRADLADLIWSVPELIPDLSQFDHLQPGDVIDTGTPESVGPVEPGDQLCGRIDGVGEVRLTIGPAA